MPLDFISGLDQISDWSGSGASDAAIGDPVVPDGIASTAALGSPTLGVSINLEGYGIVSTSRVGNPSILAALEAGAFLAIYIDGEDYSENFVELQSGGNRGVQRTMRLGGGSKGVCSFTLNNKHHDLVRPAQGAEVRIYMKFGNGIVRNGSQGLFFAGLVDKTNEVNFTGSSNFSRLTVNCVDFGALLDRVIIGREFQSHIGNDPTILTYQVAHRYFEDRLGVYYRFTGFPPRGGLGDQIFNWLTGSDVMNRIASDSGGDWRVDFERILYLFGPDGYQAAPFSIEENDGNWIDMTVDIDSSRYRNRIGVKTSQNNRALWTDTFTVAAGEFIWETMAPMDSRPQIYVDGEAAVVVDFSEIGTKEYDFYWINTTVIGRTTFDPVTLTPITIPPVGSVIEVVYLSPLSYVVWAQDDAEIADHGIWEAVETIPDVPTGDAMLAYAEALVERRKHRPVTLNITTDRDGLECGMSLTVNVPRLNVDGTFLVQSVTSGEQGQKFFRHQVMAVDRASQITDDQAFLRQIIAKHEAARDRVTQHVKFLLAETIPGIENPGLSLVEQFAINTAQATGIAQNVQIDVNLGASPPTTTDCIIDILKNGASIFPDGDENKLIWPAGTLTVQTHLNFLSDPYPIRKGDRFTVNVIQADPNAHDMHIDLSMLVG